MNLSSFLACQHRNVVLGAVLRKDSSPGDTVKCHIASCVFYIVCQGLVGNLCLDGKGATKQGFFRTKRNGNKHACLERGRSVLASLLRTDYVARHNGQVIDIHSNHQQCIAIYHHSLLYESRNVFQHSFRLIGIQQDSAHAIPKGNSYILDIIIN